MNSLTKILRAGRLASLAAALVVSPSVPSALAASGPAPAAAPSADVERAVAALRAISSMRADFVQTDRNGQRLTGTLTLQRPGKIRFQYQPGVPLLIVSDGAALTVIDYEVRQVSRWPIRWSPSSSPACAGWTSAAGRGRRCRSCCARRAWR